MVPPLWGVAHCEVLGFGCCRKPRRTSTSFSRASAALLLPERALLVALYALLQGRARLETTQIYTEVSIQYLREVYNKTHPNAQAKGT